MKYVHKNFRRMDQQFFALSDREGSGVSTVRRNK